MYHCARILRLCHRCGWRFRFLLSGFLRLHDLADLVRIEVYFLETPTAPPPPTPPRVSISATAISGKADGKESSRTAGGSSRNTVSLASSVRGRGAPKASPRSADFLLLQWKTTHPMSPRVCIGGNVKWCHPHHNDFCEGGAGGKSARWDRMAKTLLPPHG